MAEKIINQSLAEVDPEIATVVKEELNRQRNTLEMIASENFAPLSVIEASGSVLTNKYAEGYPGKRYYGGCQHADEVEDLARSRARELFSAEYANLQPHSGSQANNAVFMALLDPGDAILGLALDHGGHLSHGMKLNISGKLYQPFSYHVHQESLQVDMEEVADLAEKHKPKLIIAGWSAYSRQLDFQRFRDIADSVGAKLMVDMAHFSGLVAAGLHPNPVPLADVVTSTTHKTLWGPRGGIILAKKELEADLNRAVFPGQQGGPLMHIIAAKAVALKIAGSEDFRRIQEQIILNAQALADRLIERGVKVLSGGTDVHQLLLDLRPNKLTGMEAEQRLELIGITVNRNTIPFDDSGSALNPSGLRIGSPALTSRGLGINDFQEIGDIIADALQDNFNEYKLRSRSQEIADRYPLYPSL
jgi:glycine hydroxymethyltransferase